MPAPRASCASTLGSRAAAGSTIDRCDCRLPDRDLFVAGRPPITATGSSSVRREAVAEPHQPDVCRRRRSATQLGAHARVSGVPPGTTRRRSGPDPAAAFGWAGPPAAPAESAVRARPTSLCTILHEFAQTFTVVLGYGHADGRTA